MRSNRAARATNGVFFAGLALALAACSSASEEAGPTASPIDCALSGSAGFAADCMMERADHDGDKFVVLRHPDGGFRRFQLGVAGRGIVTADGIEQARVRQLDGVVEISVGADRYRLPIAQ